MSDQTVPRFDPAVGGTADVEAENQVLTAKIDIPSMVRAEARSISLLT